MKKAVVLFALVSVVMIFSGCSAFRLHQDYTQVPDVRTDESPVLTYLKDRVLDFWDMFGLKLHVGEGFLVHARATKLAQAGIGYAIGDKLGFKGRQVGYWEEERAEFGLLVFYINRSRKTLKISNMYMIDAEEQAMKRTAGKEDLDIYRNDDRHWASIGVCVFVGFFGIDFDFQLHELFDFLTGIVTLDPVKDDTVNRLRAKKSEFQGESAPARVYP